MPLFYTNWSAAAVPIPKLSTRPLRAPSGVLIMTSVQTTAMPTASEIHTFDLEIAPVLREFMCNNHTDLNDCVDFVCTLFDLDATDYLIDRIADEFDAFFGN